MTEYLAGISLTGPGTMKSSHLERSIGIQLLIIPWIVFALYACGSGPKELPITKLQQKLKDVPTYSIVLEDMKEEGNFFIQFFHRYRVVIPEEAENTLTGWLEVPETYFKQNEPFLGMSLMVKKEGIISSEVSPPGYQYVGDPKYGQWQTDSRGNSFWEFYGKYALLTSLLGGWNRPIYRNDYDMYRQYRNRNTPYYGPNKQYGTNGTFTKQTKPSFYSRRMAREKMKSTSFKNKVAQRTGRTRTGFRGRAGGFGK